VAQSGNDNVGMIAQSGPVGTNGENDNYAAIAQFGNNNSSMALQHGDANTIASLQQGNENTSFISQGAGLSFNVQAINGTDVGGSLTGAASIDGTGVASLGSVSNSAANLQLGNSNVSAIVQTGARNNAVNYQKSN